MTALAPSVPATARPTLLRRVWLQLRFRDALLITLVPLSALVLILAGSVSDYLRARQYDDWWSNAQTLPRLFAVRTRALGSLPQSLLLRRQFDPEAADAGIIRLEVDGVTGDSLDREPDGVWASWLEGRLRYGSSVIAVRLRKRGDNSIHWLTDKRTLTVRTPRDDFYKRYRSFGLSVKDVLPAYLANRLAQEFGLLAPGTEVVPVFLNGRFFGMYRFVEVVDESFLRPFDRMPGNIFRGDAAERGEYRKGVPRNLFDNPYLWDRAAANDRWTSAGSGQLQLLLEDLAGTTFEDHQRLMARLDRDEYARLFSYLFVVGDPWHMDGVHNQLLYEDPSTQHLHPIPWDIRLQPLSQPQHPLNPLFQEVLRDPFVVDRSMQDLARRLAPDGILPLADSLVRGAEARYFPYFSYDRLRRGLVPDVGSADQAAAVLRANVALLGHWLESDEVAFAGTAADGLTILDFETRGRVGADLLGFDVNVAPAGAPRLWLDANLNGLLDSSDPEVPLRYESGDGRGSLRPAAPVGLYAGWDTRGPAVEPGHMPYRMFLTGVPSRATLTPQLRNRATGRPITATALAPGDLLRPGSAWHPWRFPTVRPRSHRLSGDTRLTEVLRIPAGDTLIIEPGTTLRLGPEVSVIVSGRLLAQGTAARPIRILRADPRAPWGTFSLLGHGADSSIMTHMEIAEGGGAVVDRIEYIGMVNVHRADGVVIEDVTFRDNVRSDDTFHALHARIHLRRSHFLRANSDAVDFDNAGGEIVDNRFEQTGGDAIDLMTSAPLIAGNRISGSGDKGISVGEASSPLVFNNAIDSCAIGIEVKDRSEPILLHNRVSRSGTGLRERRKNWRYGGGGWATVAQSVFTANRAPRVRDAFSRLTLAAVAGLDSAGTDAVAAPTELAWLYHLTGLAVPPDAGPGLVAAWRRAAPLPPLDQQRFRDDFAAVADGWRASGGITRLEKRRDALVIEVERRTGRATRPVQWRLPDGGTLVLELAGRDLSRSRVVVAGDSGQLLHDFAAGQDLSTAGFVTVALPPGTYTGLGLELEPVPGLTRLDPATGLTVLRGGRLDLRGYRLIPAAPR